MYYQEYLSNLCTRRQWPEPVFRCYQSRDGTFYSMARVNNREYMSDGGHETGSLAREDAAMQAYWRCQNFSRNDGKHPKDASRGAESQGRPVAIGTERGNTSICSDDSRSSTGSYGSGGSSPTAAASVYQQHLHQHVQGQSDFRLQHEHRYGFTSDPHQDSRNTHSLRDPARAQVQRRY